MVRVMWEDDKRMDYLWRLKIGVPIPLYLRLQFIKAGLSSSLERENRCQLRCHLINLPWLPQGRIQKIHRSYLRPVGNEGENPEVLPSSYICHS